MISCQQIEAYLAGELSPMETEAFEMHLTTCDRCSEVVDVVAQMKLSIRRASEQLENPPSGLRDRLRQTIDSRLIQTRPEGRRYDNRRFTAVVIAAGILLAVGISLVVIPSTKELAEKTAADPIELIERNVTSDVQPPTIQLSDDQIGVPVESGNPNVTILLVYEVMSPSAMSDDMDMCFSPLVTTNSKRGIR